MFFARRGVLAHAKNDDELFWEEKISCSQWERPKHVLKVPCFFFPFTFAHWGEGGGEKRGEDSFSFFPGSKCETTMFLLSSQWVPNMFPPSSHCVPQHVLHSTSLSSHMLWQMLSSFHLHRWGKGEKLYTSKYNILFWGASIVSFFF